MAEGTHLLLEKRYVWDDVLLPWYPLCNVYNTLIIVPFIHVHRCLSAKLVIQYASVIYGVMLMCLLINGRHCLMAFGKLQTLTFRMPTYVDVCRYQKSNDVIQEKEVSPAGGTVDSTMSKLALFQ